MKNLIIFLIPLLLLGACSNKEKKSDGYGNFEATEVILSAEAQGRIVQLTIEEGMQVKQGDIIGVIDTVQLSLKREQLKASILAVAAKQQDVKVQIDVLTEKKSNILREKKRIENLLKDKAATQKQFDDINGELEVIDRQILATATSMNTSNKGLMSEIKPLEVQLKQIEDQIAKSYIKSPITGMILTKYAETGEITSFGKPLAKIADVEQLTLRVYISGLQLPKIKINQKVKVLIDKTETENTELEGTIEWVADKAEFTPKIIQTKEERINMVYAVKIKVKNDGTLKIGMPAEVNF